MKGVYDSKINFLNPLGYNFQIAYSGLSRIMSWSDILVPKILSILFIFLFLSGCNCKDNPLCLPINRCTCENEETLYTDYEERANGEIYLLKHFLKPYYLVFDVGANVGSWSKRVLDIQPNTELIAFEPIPEVFARLKKDIGCKALSIYNLALSDRIGQTDFFFYNENWYTSKLSGFYKRPVNYRKINIEPLRIQVEQDTLDHFCYTQDIQNIDLLKIGTEGYEMKILFGAKKLLEEQKIRTIQFEYDTSYQHKGATLKQVVKYLTNLDYILFRITPSGLIHIQEWKDCYENGTHINYFAVRKKDMANFAPISNLEPIHSSSSRFKLT